jgi:hypothetical protein
MPPGWLAPILWSCAIQEFSMNRVAFAARGRTTSPPHAATSLMESPGRPAAAPAMRRLEDRQFLEMDRSYARSGGTATGDEVARRLRRWSEQPLSTIARWIVDRRIVCFEWEGQTLVPLFQFDLDDMTIRAGVTAVVNELKDVFDMWELAVWFAQPNTWLDEACPVDEILTRPHDVLQAARSDRFVALG